jgi:cytochrome d ubiquinol oxidase subunit II
VPESQIFSLMGALVLLPIILGYFAFVFWTFRAKVGLEDGYH